MTEEFNDEPFDRVHEILDSIEYLEPEVKDLGVERVDDDERRRETVHNAINYVEQARRFLKGAEHHNSGEAYKMGDDSIDDLQQNLQILAIVYPEPIREVKAEISEIWKEKRRVYDSLTIEPERIVDREYNQILLELRDEGLLESSQENHSVVVDKPHYRPPSYMD